MAADAASVNAADTAGFTVTVFNQGPGDASGVVLSDPLPAGIGHDLNWQLDGSSPDASRFQISGATGNQVLSLVGTNVALAAGVRLTVHVTSVTSAKRNVRDFI